ncbi:2-succinyl-5-enolpyruvyl-6-hydroxy-3-cyclohexene-1-carboxylate synthase [Vibrio splendidus]|uniref:thiamine pyrophosphate-binding protein n=1 Tax=Vibrio splendidus TaxID=29497 RepID=UPI000D3AA21E|nr:thiamine pyrophosphate-binding protein [Vibrio splendidus]PTP60930.1 2-succinyl-5-enolpyruvyl-6-hydroxy-3-cyclohexene-1-carboxylate synthase [Vibrio splendidus]
MFKSYTDEKNVQVIISLLKQNNISKIIVSPGATNVTFVRSIQYDSFFEIYSAVDERSAAYMACGLAAESGEPVVISCTGATASRNYIPALTEAYYRKLPILAITSTQSVSRVGHHIAQVIDRSSIQNDIAKLSVTLPIVKDDEDLWECEVQVNKAILELKRHGGGPVHINSPTNYCSSYNTKELPKFRAMDRIDIMSRFPELPKGRIAIFVGAHETMSLQLTKVIDQFCASNNAVVFCDHTSGYKGKYRVLYSLCAGQNMFDKEANRPDVLIHIGEVTGDYYTTKNIGKEVWRVSKDGEIRDTFRKLSYVFEMPEEYFFEHYSNNGITVSNSYYTHCKKQLEELYNKLPELPYSNIWVASKIAHKIPDNSTIHFGILNSLRSWNFFELPSSVLSTSTVGGFGIDGGVSSLVGASLSDENKLYFGILGDLAFFYDMNAIGNRHISNNLRIMLVNNGKGTEFKLHTAAGNFGDKTDDYIAAAGHFGSKSPDLVKFYAKSLGFDYMSASSKDEFNNVYNVFLSSKPVDKSIIFEVFTNSEEESNALELMMNIEENTKGKAKQIAKQLLGKKGISSIKKLVSK